MFFFFHSVVMLIEMQIYFLSKAHEWHKMSIRWSFHVIFDVDDVDADDGYHFYYHHYESEFFLTFFVYNFLTFHFIFLYMLQLQYVMSFWKEKYSCIPKQKKTKFMLTSRKLEESKSYKSILWMVVASTPIKLVINWKSFFPVWLIIQLYIRWPFFLRSTFWSFDELKFDKDKMALFSDQSTKFNSLWI